MEAFPYRFTVTGVVIDTHNFRLGCFVQWRWSEIVLYQTPGDVIRDSLFFNVCYRTDGYTHFEAVGTDCLRLRSCAAYGSAIVWRWSKRSATVVKSARLAALSTFGNYEAYPANCGGDLFGRKAIAT